MNKTAFIFNCIVMLLMAASGGCDSPKPTFDVHSADPSIKIPAIKIAVEEKDFGKLRQMVKDLDSDDSAVRFYAVEGLRRLTGETFGYQYFDDSAERAPAVLKWQKWLSDNDPTSRSASSSSSSASSAPSQPSPTSEASN